MTCFCDNVRGTICDNCFERQVVIGRRTAKAQERRFAPVKRRWIMDPKELAAIERELDELVQVVSR